MARITYRLATANIAFCREASAPQPGFTIHRIEQYDVADRQRVSAAYGLGSNAGVMAVVPLSPAEKAGLKANDQLLSVNGRALTPAIGVSGVQPTRLLVDQAQKIVLEEVRTGEVTLRVSDTRGVRDVRLTPELGCPSNVELVPGDDVNAWADGDRIVVSAALLEQCDTDDDLALVIAHELAHNLLHHSDKLAIAGGSAGEVLELLGSGSATMRQTEEEADRLAVRLMTAATYDMTRAEAFLRRLLDGRDASMAGTHPTADRRLALLKVEIAAAREISPARQAR